MEQGTGKVAAEVPIPATPTLHLTASADDREVPHMSLDQEETGIRQNNPPPAGTEEGMRIPGNDTAVARK